MTVDEAKAYAKERLSAFGWDKSEFKSLEQLWEAESNWNYQAYNKKSDTRGIPQLKGWQNVPNYENNYKLQIEHGLDYIKNRPKYGTPTKAWNFHKNNGWY